MLGLGERFPHYVLPASLGSGENGAIQTVSDKDFRGRWKVYFFWPKDFTELSQSEIRDFGDLLAELRERGTVLLGCSVESELAHRTWRTQEEDLRGLDFPMLADVKRDLCGELGILDEAEGVAQRATFIVDQQDVIRFVYVTDTRVSRDPGEVLRVLADLQEGR